MLAQDSVPPLSEGVAHAMAVGAEVGVRAVQIGTSERRRFPREVSPDHDEVLRVVRDVFLLKILVGHRARSWARCRRRPSHVRVSICARRRQGSSLRSDRVIESGSGLDRACAQTALWAIT